MQGADEGDTTTIIETATAAAEQIEDVQVEVKEPQPLEEIVDAMTPSILAALTGCDIHAPT